MRTTNRLEHKPFPGLIRFDRLAIPQVIRRDYAAAAAAELQGGQVVLQKRILVFIIQSSKLWHMRQDADDLNYFVQHDCRRVVIQLWAAYRITPVVEKSIPGSKY
ncbi:hypothetical protein Vretimale_1574, partial [Volvox reticuliferus]